MVGIDQRREVSPVRAFDKNKHRENQFPDKKKKSNWHSGAGINFKELARESAEIAVAV